MKTYHSASAQETEDIARIIGGKLKNGDVIAFAGGMGMGKTVFTRGLIQGLGIDPQQVSSPTFSLVNEYHGKENLTVYHFDMYRIQDEEDLYTTGFFDYFDIPCIIVIEWSENIQSVLPDDIITICISKGDGDDDRVITIQGGERF